MPALVAVLAVTLPVIAAHLAVVTARPGGAPARHVTIENVAARRPAPVVATAVGDRDGAGVGTWATPSADAVDPGLVPMLVTSPGDAVGGDVGAVIPAAIPESDVRVVAGSTLPRPGAGSNSTTPAPGTAFDAWYEAAGVPPQWRAELAAIAMCESRGNPAAVGDGGRSLGLHQLNWATWFPYALALELVTEGERELWYDPVVNSKVAVGAVRYDLERGYSAFKQWTCQP